MKDIMHYINGLSNFKLCVTALEKTKEDLSFIGAKLLMMEFEGGKPATKRQNARIIAHTRLT